MRATLDRLGLPAFAYRPYQVFFASNLLANAGIFIFMASFGWFVHQATGSAALVGLAYGILGLPWLLLMLHAGMLTDRIGARISLAVSLVTGGLAMAAVAGVALLPNPSVVLVLGLAFVMGVFMTIGAPGSISIVGELVPPAALSSAVSLNFLLINVARIAGGAAAGVLLADGRSPGFAILVAAVMFAVPGIFVWRLRTPPTPRSARGSVALLRPIIEAAAHAFRFPTLGMILLLSAGPGLIGLPYNFLLPVAADELGIGAQGLGLLLTAAGTGGLVAGLAAEHVQRALGHGRSIFVGLAAAAGGLITFGLGLGLQASLIGIGFAGGGFVVYASSSLTLVQALAPPALKGRLTSVFSLLYWGLMPVGGVLGGLVAQAAGARMAMLGAGIVLAVLGAIALVRRPQVLTLAVSRDGMSLVGDLAGSGAIEGGLGAPVAPVVLRTADLHPQQVTDQSRSSG